MLETVPPLLEELRGRHPKLTVFVREIDSAEAIPRLESAELDLAFVRLDVEIDAGIAALPLTEDRLAVAFPDGHPLATQHAFTCNPLAANLRPCRHDRLARFTLIC